MLDVMGGKIYSELTEHLEEFMEEKPSGAIKQETWLSWSLPEPPTPWGHWGGAAVSPCPIPGWRLMPWMGQTGTLQLRVSLLLAGVGQRPVPLAPGHAESRGGVTWGGRTRCQGGTGSVGTRCQDGTGSAGSRCRGGAGSAGRTRCQGGEGYGGVGAGVGKGLRRPGARVGQGLWGLPGADASSIVPAEPGLGGLQTAPATLGLRSHRKRWISRKAAEKKTGGCARGEQNTFA